MNTKQDYLNLKDTRAGRNALQSLLNHRFIWKETAVLDSKEDGIEDDLHQIIEDENGFIQQEYVEDENARIFQLGFTVEEVQELLGDK